jgi:hypothetical protein
LKYFHLETNIEKLLQDVPIPEGKKHVSKVLTEKSDNPATKVTTGFYFYVMN